MGTVAGRNATTIKVSCVTGQTVVISRRAGGTQGDLYAVNEFGGALTPLANSTDDEVSQGITTDGRVVGINHRAQRKFAASSILPLPT